jgi:hypothetical protein
VSSRARCASQRSLELGERGIDLGDVQGWLGHKHVTTTRKHYAPVLVSRLKRASESLDGRFGGWDGKVSQLSATDDLAAASSVEGVH